MDFTGALEQIKLEDFDTSLSIYRLLLPGQVVQMCQSLERMGQLQPVITRKSGDLYQLIDGFKRYYASQQSGFPGLLGKVLNVSESVGKAMIMACNKEGHSLIDYEEGLIVYSLKKEHQMSQKEISELTGYSQTWVCRRVSMIERLEDAVQSQLRLGKISAAHVREIIKLPRGNQAEITRTIMENNMSSRQSAWLIGKYLSSGSKAERAYLLDHPNEAKEKAGKETIIYDVRLSAHGNQLLKTSELLYLQQNIFIGYYYHVKTDQLGDMEKMVLRPKLNRVFEQARKITAIEKKTN